MLIGAVPARKGVLRLAGHHINLAAITPAGAIAAGISYVPGERLREGCIGELSVAENVGLPVLGRFFRGGWLHRRALASHARAQITRLGVRPDDPALALEALSGGNQQKVLLAKWLQLEPRLLILQEPTQGVDVGAREQIFSIIREFAARGGGVLCLSGDHEQLALLCPRVLIFRRGRIARELTGSEVTKERIAHECLGSDIRRRRAETASRQSAIGPFIHRYALLFAWAITIAIFGVLEPDSFLQIQNFTSIFNSQAVLVVLTCSLVLTLTSSEYDLSAASVLSLSAMLIAVLNAQQGCPSGGRSWSRSPPVCWSAPSTACWS